MNNIYYFHLFWHCVTKIQEKLNISRNQKYPLLWLLISYDTTWRIPVFLFPCKSCHHHVPRIITGNLKMSFDNLESFQENLPFFDLLDMRNLLCLMNMKQQVFWKVTIACLIFGCIFQVLQLLCLGQTWRGEERKKSLTVFSIISILSSKNEQTKK